MSSEQEQETIMYERGFVAWHSSEEDGGPDVGISIGLGNDQMLYVGELPNPENYGMKVYGQNDAATFLVAELSEEHELHRFIELLAVLLRQNARPPLPEGVEAALETLADIAKDRAADAPEWRDDERITCSISIGILRAATATLSRLSQEKNGSEG